MYAEGEAELGPLNSRVVIGGRVRFQLDELLLAIVAA